jgi:hypothetical protein
VRRLRDFDQRRLDEPALVVARTTPENDAAAGVAEPKAVMQGIRGAQESYKAEMLVYLNVSSSLDAWYPAGTLNDQKRAWGGAHPDATNWRLLNVTTDSAVRFGYASVAGVGTSFTATPHAGFTWHGLPQAPLTDPQFAPRGPWYVIQAAGDRDVDGTYATKKRMGHIQRCARSRINRRNHLGWLVSHVRNNPDYIFQKQTPGL